MSTEWFYTKRLLGSFIVYEDWDKPICAVNDEEHARIIIAAPKMLEALEYLTAEIDDVVNNGWLRQQPRYIAALDAIAKAKGETP